MIPIILHHGLFGFGQLQVGKLQVSYFNRIDRHLAARGHPLIIPRVHPTGGIATRARQLKDAILQQVKVQGFGDRRMLLIAHSLGGLDARYMIRELGMAEHIAALLTVSTPHRGSPYADWCVRHLGERLGGLQLMRFLNLDVQGIVDLTTDACRRFNDRIEDVAGVRYFSVSASRPWQRVPPIAYHSHRVITEAEGDNDGLVSVRSATWAEHLATWPADHWHTINRRLVVELVAPTGSIVPYYLSALDRILPLCIPAA